MLTAMVSIHNKQYKISDVGAITVSSLNILRICLRSLAPSTCICARLSRLDALIDPAILLCINLIVYVGNMC
jgi:hypothetical protein